MYAEIEHEKGVSTPVLFKILFIGIRTLCLGVHNKSIINSNKQYIRTESVHQ